MTVNEFCSNIGISRQKFYRFVKEPRRFSEENIERIQAVLRLTPTEVKKLRIYLHPESITSSPDQPKSYGKYINALFKRQFSSESLMNQYEIEYIEEAGTVSIHSPKTLADIISGFSCIKEIVDETEKNSTTAESIMHDFTITIYNCLSPETNVEVDHVPSKSIMIIAGIIKALEDFFAPSENAVIHIRQYLSESQRRLMMDHDSKNEKAMVYNFNLLSDILPLLSIFLDYTIDTMGASRHFWTEHNNLCLIDHKILSDNSHPSDQNERTGFLSTTETEYFALTFSDSGDCSACRLGSEEMSHIFRFLSTDTRNKNNQPSETFIPSNPNLAFYEYGRTLRHAQFHPNLCFDDIPSEMWFSLYSIVESIEDKIFLESVFRKLIDPNNQYTFLDFQALVYLAIHTLEQRAAMNSKNGKIVVCHSEGLKDLVRTGIITDLKPVDTGSSGWSRNCASLRFPTHMIKDLLLLIRNSIARRQSSSLTDPLQYDWVNYYILQPKFPYPEVSYIVYRDFGIFPLYYKSHHRHTSTNAFQNSAIGTVTYDYIINEMIGKRGQKLDSDILSDEHSIALIDKLISQLEEEHS